MKKEESMYDYILEPSKGMKKCLGDGKHYIKGKGDNGICFRCLMTLSYIKS